MIEARQSSLEMIAIPLHVKGSLTTDSAPKGRPLPLQSRSGEGA